MRATPPGTTRVVRSLLLRRASLAAYMASMVCIACTGCMVVGYRSGGGWFVWPGGFGLILLVLAILFFMRRR